MSKWVEIDNEYFDTDSRCICIDAWEHQKENDPEWQGRTIARVHLDKTIDYIDKDAENDEFVKETIDRVLKIVDSLVDIELRIHGHFNNFFVNYTTPDRLIVHALEYVLGTTNYLKDGSTSDKDIVQACQLSVIDLVDDD